MDGEHSPFRNGGKREEDEEQEEEGEEENKETAIQVAEPRPVQQL